MSEKSQKSVILFNTTTSAIRSENMLKKLKFQVKLISTPRQFSSDCGLSLEIKTSDKDEILQIIESKKIEIKSIEECG